MVTVRKRLNKEISRLVENGIALPDEWLIDDCDNSIRNGVTDLIKRLSHICQALTGIDYTAPASEKEKRADSPSVPPQNYSHVMKIGDAARIIYGKGGEAYRKKLKRYIEAAPNRAKPAMTRGAYSFTLDDPLLSALKSAKK